MGIWASRLALPPLRHFSERLESLEAAGGDNGKRISFRYFP
jgi:hypothetical protein